MADKKELTEREKYIKELQTYRRMTVRDLVEYVQYFEGSFPKGLDTPIDTGDFEGNYTHLKHEFQEYHEHGEEPAVVLAYEMHEGGN